MLLPHLVFLASGAIKNITELGHSTVTITRTDLVFIDLRGKIALFTDTLDAGLSVGYRSRENTYRDYFPVSAPEFTASGISIAVRTSLRRVDIRLWLVNASACPDVTNIASLTTDRVMLLETGIDGPLCLFPRLKGVLYHVDIETLLGIPRILFFTARGRGYPSKTCQGEADLCTIESTEPFFMVFERFTRVNLTYRVDNYRRPPPTLCAVAGIPTIMNRTLVDVAPRLVAPERPYCLWKENSLMQTVIGMGMLALAAGAALLALRIVGMAAIRRCLGPDAGACCVIARETYDRCS
jgi:hypothetical protein